MKIVPAILTDDPQELDQLLREIRDSKKFERVQIDFVDGEYVNNKSLRVEECKSISNYPELRFDAQLMVVEKNLWRWVQETRELGFDRIIPQVESVSRPEDFDCLAMDFHSPVAVLEPYLARLKYVLVMSVEPGRGGQEFAEEAIERIRQIGQMRQIGGYKYKIGVDGGILKEHLKMLEEAGADEVAVGAKRVLLW